MSLAIPAAVAVFGVWLLLVLGRSVPPVEAVSRREAVDLLQPLVGEFGVELTDSQRQLVGSECLQIQTGILESRRDRLPALKAKYQDFLAGAGGYIWGLTNQLNAFADDGSSLNLAMVELRRFRLALDEQFASYDRSLEVAAAVNCVAYPEHFVAGLHQVRADYQSLSATAAGLDDFLDNRLTVAFIATECHLFDLDNPDCH